MSLNLSRNFIVRLHWLVRLRWLAVGGVILTTLFIHKILKIPLPIHLLYVVAAVIGIYNLIFFLLLLGERGKAANKTPLTLNRIANLQIFFDLVSLAVLIHLSGGIENPFVFYFIFHMIIASIFLTRRAAFGQATFAAFLFCSVVTLERLNILRHHCLEGFVTCNAHGNFLYIAGISFAFVSTLYIAVYMATSISMRLRKREMRLKAANELLKKKDRIKSEYVLRVTHDIKGHLAAIQSCVGPVTAGITGPLNEGQRDLLKRVSSRTEKLLFFVRALLKVTNIKLSRGIKTDYFSFKDMLSDVISHASLRASDKNISIKLSIDPTIDKIKGSEEYIQESIMNLVANSIKYTPRNGSVDIVVRDKGNEIFMQVHDTGIGIPEDELPKIFEEFYRARNAKETEKDGTGLGLSIVKQIVERHNGRIWAESEEGKGSTFSLILPK